MNLGYFERQAAAPPKHGSECARLAEAEFCDCGARQPCLACPWMAEDERLQRYLDEQHQDTTSGPLSKPTPQPVFTGVPR